MKGLTVSTQDLLTSLNLHLLNSSYKAKGMRTSYLLLSDLILCSINQMVLQCKEPDKNKW